MRAGKLSVGTFPVLVWVVLVATAIAARPLLPIDETRYMAVAWEMHRTGDWLVLHLNGETYAHKPPLMFWLINAGWAAFGVVEWWARLISPLSALGAALVTGALAQRLFPRLDPRAIFWAAALILLGTTTFALYSTLVLFDAMMVLFAVLGVYGLVCARDGMRGGFALFGLAIGLGVLTKGPVILVYTLPPALLAPLWIGADRRPAWARWYGGVGLGVALGAVIALAWAIPAAQAGGAAYGEALFWKQSSGRIVESFAHRRPVWWYVVLLPVLLFPWSAWPPLWRTMAGLRRCWIEMEGARLCIVWFAAGLVIMSLISGKQVHYILPLFPALAALLAAHVVARPPIRRDGWWPALILAALGLIAIAAVLVGPLHDAIASRGVPTDAWTRPVLFAGLAWVAVAGIAALGNGAGLRALATVALLSLLALVALQIAIGPNLRAQFDVAPAARVVGGLQRAGSPVAIVGEYHGELDFAGRLAPVEVLGNEDLPPWIERNPGGTIVTMFRKQPRGEVPIYAQRIRGRTLAVWPASAIRRDPRLAVPD